MLKNLRASLEGKLQRWPFFRDVVFVGGGAFLGQAVALVCAPVLSRLYAPGDFGVLAVYAAFLSAMTAFSGLGLHLAIPLTETRSRAWRVAGAAFLAHGFMAVVFSVLLFFFQGALRREYPFFSDLLLMGCLLVGFLLSGIYDIFSYLGIREKAFATIARTRISQGVWGALSGVGLGVLGVRPLGLVVSQVCNMAAGISVLRRRLVPPGSVRELFSRELWDDVVAFRRFPLFQPWTNLSAILSSQIVPILFARFGGVAAAGILFFNMKVLQVPMMFVGNAVAQVFFQRGSELSREGHLGVWVAKVFRGLMLVGLYPVAVTVLLGPQLFPVIFGAAWKEAGALLPVMGPWFFAQFLTSPLSSVMYIRGQQRCDFICSLVQLCLRITSISLGLMYFDMQGAIVLFSGANVFFYISYLFLVLKFSHVSFSDILNSIKESFLFLVTCLVPLAPLWYFSEITICIITLPLMSAGMWVFLLKRKLKELKQ
ncbi:MAG TPA: oligosaccharide flippase family protein [Synergistaceae bacterium]|nr:oligosaccharide flippase family protein [Synergistaceae bacterium]HQF90857.1 oligosaccharide flippase family protein [Synergistaceae bacterium]HQH78000.1 oligosaccharide flippase family protein [Synergistaceae bacterium]HQK25186.1 oligosaccharide flippase family protein [Synergistaceae bacterium]